MASNASSKHIEVLQKRLWLQPFPPSHRSPLSQGLPRRVPQPQSSRAHFQRHCEISVKTGTDKIGTSTNLGHLRGPLDATL